MGSISRFPVSSTRAKWLAGISSHSSSLKVVGSLAIMTCLPCCSFEDDVSSFEPLGNLRFSVTPAVVDTSVNRLISQVERRIVFLSQCRNLQSEGGWLVVLFLYRRAHSTLPSVAARLREEAASFQSSGDRIALITVMIAFTV